MKYYLMAKNWFAAEEGQDLIEYALIAALLSLAAVAGIGALGGNVAGVWTSLSTALTGAGS